MSIIIHGFTVVELANGKTYGIHVTATTADGRSTSTGSRSFQTPSAAASVAATTSSPSSSSAASVKYYYIALFGLLIAGFVMLCCNCCNDERWPSSSLSLSNHHHHHHDRIKKGFPGSIPPAKQLYYHYDTYSNHEWTHCHKIPQNCVTLPSKMYVIYGHTFTIIFFITQTKIGFNGCFGGASHHCQHPLDL